MKYTLIIEGTKDKIEKAKIAVDYAVVWHAQPHIGKIYEPMTYKHQVRVTPEFRIVEPKYRYKTLAELAEEFPHDLGVDTTEVRVKALRTFRINLGKEALNVENMCDDWTKIFLKEIT